MRRRAEIAHATALNVMATTRAALDAAREAVKVAEGLRTTIAEREAVLAASRNHLARCEAVLQAATAMVESAAQTRSVTEHSEISRLGVPILT